MAGAENSRHCCITGSSRLWGGGCFDAADGLGQIPRRRVLGRHGSVTGLLPGGEPESGLALFRHTQKSGREIFFPQVSGADGSALVQDQIKVQSTHLQLLGDLSSSFFAAGLLVAAKGQIHIPAWSKPILQKLLRRLENAAKGAFAVQSAPAVDGFFLDFSFKGRMGPVLALCGHHIHVGAQQHRPLFPFFRAAPLKQKPIPRAVQQPQLGKNQREAFFQPAPELGYGFFVPGDGGEAHRLGEFAAPFLILFFGRFRKIELGLGVAYPPPQTDAAPQEQPHSGQHQQKESAVDPQAVAVGKVAGKNLKGSPQVIKEGHRYHSGLRIGGAAGFSWCPLRSAPPKGWRFRISALPADRPRTIPAPGGRKGHPESR